MREKVVVVYDEGCLEEWERRFVRAVYGDDAIFISVDDASPVTLSYDFWDNWEIVENSPVLRNGSWSCLVLLKGPFVSKWLARGGIAYARLLQFVRKMKVASLASQTALFSEEDLRQFKEV